MGQPNPQPGNPYDNNAPNPYQQAPPQQGTPAGQNPYEAHYGGRVPTPVRPRHPARAVLSSLLPIAIGIAALVFLAKGQVTGGTEAEYGVGVFGGLFILIGVVLIVVATVRYRRR
ncbi:DUF202 domain-containing protein [Sciscionella marina]|uniref:DUF202 domain-containing protein n=1 Tax=Sciscionella marina TaxID=508770 RepID=UPI0003673D6B|nr:DUF202 domain-containing protein [Sciscionella marina]